MFKTRHKEDGFTILEVLLLLVVIIAIAGISFFVIHAHKDNNQIKPSVANHDLTYNDQQANYAFSYPSQFGSFSTIDNDNVDDTPAVTGTIMRASNSPTNTYMPGLAGPLNLFTYPAINSTIEAGFYGPYIRLQNGKWIVTQAAQVVLSGMPVNNAGNEYQTDQRLQSKDSIVSASVIKNDDFTIYRIPVTGDSSGSLSYLLAFIAQNKLQVIIFPEFNQINTASISSDPNQERNITYSVADVDPYIQLVNKIGESIKKL